MTLESGSTLGPYEILSPLGSGGMGEVYRARDSKLNRDVAVKILPAEVAEDGERLARFKREAQVLASLNHPHIAAIYGLEEDGDRPFLVLELVEGETLAERLGRGAVPVEEAVVLAQQVAEALEQAHAKGIVHRDLKPANIKITPEGKIKVLDFGLAKALAGESDDGDAVELSQSPTMTRQTAAGVILGTAAYMSPEQARGKSVDKRADIWAFGVVLFEMLTGRTLFDGDTVSDVLAAVLRADIDWTKLPRDTPPGLRRLLRRALTRDPSERLHDIGDARLELRDVHEEEAVPVVPAPTRPSRRTIVLFLLGAAVLGGIVAWTAKPDIAGRTSAVRFALPIPAPPRDDQVISGSAVALSPDGSHLVFASRDALYLRRMDELDFRRLEGTDGGYGPFFAPDGEWIGFFAGGKLKKVSLVNDAVLTLCDAPEGRGGAWRENGTILFAPNHQSGLFTVSTAGGVPQELTRPDPEREEVSHRWPSLLPDGEHALVTIQKGPEGRRAAVALVELETGDWETLVEPAYDGRYSPTGHIVYAREGVMLAARFDSDRMGILGEAVPVLADLTGPDLPFTQVSYALSRDVVLAYVPPIFGERGIELIDLDGNRSSASVHVSDISGVSFSPDGRRAAVGVSEGERDEVWQFDVERALLTRLGSMEGLSPLWSPDGRRLAVRQGLATTNIVVLSVDEDSPPETWVTHSQNVNMGDWTPDGSAILYSKRESQYYYIAMKSVDGEEQILLDDPFRHAYPRLSPDGRWLAYQSDENGRYELFVRAFPSMDGKKQISTSGGIEPVWSPDGMTLYYLSDGALMSVAMTPSEAGLAVGGSRRLFEVEHRVDALWANYYDIAADGKTFVFATGSESDDATQIRVVLNGLDELTGER